MKNVDCRPKSAYKRLDMGKKDKKSKDDKKKLKAEKAAKAAAKSEKKAKKQAQAEDEDDVGIDEILASYAKQQEEYNAVTVVPVDRPSKRLNPSLVASPVQGKRELLLFGGETTKNDLAVFYNDLYTYSVDSDQWRKITSPNSPMPRSGHAMCAHPSGVVLLFGGEFSSPKQTTFYHYGDTWILDPATKEWTKVEAKKGPSARSGHRMVTWKNYILLHGGFRDLATSTTYLGDLWAFDVTSYQWHQIEFPQTLPVPDARSGHSFVPFADGAALWGGYSKVKAGRGLQKGKVHVDSWLLKMKPDLKGVRWERRKRGGYAPSPRVGCSMVHHRGRGILFGGVYDTDETEESLSSTFFNSLYAYQIEQNKWFALTLRAPRKKQAVQQSNKVEDRHADLENELAEILGKKLGLDNDGENDAENNADKSREQTPVPDEDKREYPVVPNLPHPRFNAATAVVDDNLFIFGGVWENGDNEYTLDSFYSVNLGRLDGLKVYWEDLRELEEEAAASSDEDDEGDDYDDENEEELPVEDEEEEEPEEEEEEEEEEPAGTPDPRPWLPHPKAFETLRAFYVRTADAFVEWAFSQDKDARGKDLKRIAFELAEDRWWERREDVRAQEDQYEELGGVADVVERDPAQTKKAGRR